MWKRTRKWTKKKKARRKMSKKKTKKLPDILHFLFQSVDLPPCSRSDLLWKI